MNDFICNSDDIKTSIEFYGISKTIEILNEKLEQCNYDELNVIEEIVHDILILDEQFNKYDKKLKAIKKIGDIDKEKKELQSRIDKALFNIQRIIAYGFDYDGFNSVERLKGLIDMLVDYAEKAKDILKGEDNDTSSNNI